MTIREISENLCYYDARNPDGCDDFDVIDAHKIGLKSGRIAQCFCDNCFHGRTTLANELLNRIATV